MGIERFEGPAGKNTSARAYLVLTKNLTVKVAEELGVEDKK
jgi:hypothetical protein